MKPIKKLILNATVITTIICIVITAVNSVSDPTFDFVEFIFSRGMLRGFLIGFLLYIANSLSFLGIRKIFPEDTFYIKRFLLFIPTTIILTITIVFLVNLVVFRFDNRTSLSDFMAKQHAGNYFNMVVISIIVSLIIFGFYFYKIFKENQLKKQTQIAGEATAQFESLKNQIDPHFLFNSLNVLTGLIEENPNKAIDYTNSLSRIYRYILEQKDKETVTIAQELDFAQNYINLLKLRFEDAITYQIDSEAINEKGSTVSLALQLLLENCIQHNIATEESKLNIRIRKEQNYLLISNNLQEKKGKLESTKIGLKNIIDRYSLLTKIPVEIVKDDQNFIVKLPILNTNA